MVKGDRLPEFRPGKERKAEEGTEAKEVASGGSPWPGHQEILFGFSSGALQGLEAYWLIWESIG
jgi:hypothetical protein